MTLDTTLPVWTVIIFIIPIIFGAMFTAIMMWKEQKDHKIQIANLAKEQIDIKKLIETKNEKLVTDQMILKSLIETKNEKTLDELQEVTRELSNTKITLAEIKGLLTILINDRQDLRNANTKKPLG